MPTYESPSKPHYVTLDTAVAELGGIIPIGTLRQWVFDGRLAAYKPGKRVLVRMVDVYRLIEAHPHKSNAIALKGGR